MPGGVAVSNTFSVAGCVQSCGSVRGAPPASVLPAMYRSQGLSRAAVFAEALVARRPSTCSLSSAISDSLEEETTRCITVKQSFDPCAQTAQVPSMPLDSGPQVIPGALLLSPVRAPGRRRR